MPTGNSFLEGIHHLRKFCLQVLQFDIPVNNISLTAVSGVGSSPALAKCQTSQDLLAGVSGGFSRGSPVFAPSTDWPVSYELK